MIVQKSALVGIYQIQ